MTNISLMTNGIRLFFVFLQYSSLAFALVMLLTRNDGLSFYLCCPGSFCLLFSTTKAFLKRYFKAFHFESFFTTWPEDPSLSTQRAGSSLGSHSLFLTESPGKWGSVSPQPRAHIKERDWGKMVATTSFSSKGNKANTINL